MLVFKLSIISDWQCLAIAIESKENLLDFQYGI
jgi:hypothetical protein